MRRSTKIVVFLIFLNGAVSVGHASGFFEDAGVAPNPGQSKALEDAKQNANQTSANSGFGSTLFGVYSAVTQTYQSFVHAMFAGPLMFKSMGVPGWLVDFVFAPIYIIAALDVIYAISGRVL